MDECEHLNINRDLSLAGEPHWVCAVCSERFWPGAIVDETVQQMVQRQDVVEEVAASLLWRMHEMAMQRHGPEVAAEMDAGQVKEADWPFLGAKE